MGPVFVSLPLLPWAPLEREGEREREREREIPILGMGLAMVGTPVLKAF